MGDETKILIIEDTQDDYCRIYRFLTSNGYTCFPKEGEYSNFINDVQNHVKGSTKFEATTKLRDYFATMVPQLIILDVQLTQDEKDLSGLEFKNFLRNLYPYVPILLLTIHTFDEVIKAFTEDGKANYFLNKILDDASLSDDFLERRLSPVVAMLLYWYELSHSKTEIFNYMQSRMDDLELFIDKTVGVLKFDMMQFYDSVDDLKKHTEVLLRIAQFNISLSDKKAGDLVNKFIEEFTLITDVPLISDNKAKIVERLIESKKEFVKIIKGEIVNKDMASFIKDSVKDIIGADKDDAFSKAVLLSLCKSIGSVWKFYRTGSF